MAASTAPVAILRGSPLRGAHLRMTAVFGLQPEFIML
jgi:hypothetical protein